MVKQWLVLLLNSKNILEQLRRFSVPFTCFPQACVGSVWVSGFLPQSEEIHEVRLISDSKLAIGVNCYLSLCESWYRLVIYSTLAV